MQDCSNLNCFFRNRVSNRTVNGMIASLVICNIKKKKKKTSPGPRASKRKKKKKNSINSANRFGSESRIKVYLVESNRIEPKTQVEKSNRNPI